MTTTPPTLPVTRADLLALGTELLRISERSPRKPGDTRRVREGLRVMVEALAEWAEQERRGELRGELPY